MMKSFSEYFLSLVGLISWILIIKFVFLDFPKILKSVFYL